MYHSPCKGVVDFPECTYPKSTGQGSLPNTGGCFAPSALKHDYS